MIENVAPARERGLKFSSSEDAYKKDSVAPARERGLKFLWKGLYYEVSEVAPARERGLKSCPRRGDVLNGKSRSREGAWIEIWHDGTFLKKGVMSLPRGSVD